MVKKAVLLFITTIVLHASVFEKNCNSCHKSFPVEIDKFLYRYILKHSSERDVKTALIEYLKNPTKEKTVMPEPFIKRFGIKKPTTLSENELKEAVDDYWLMYKIIGTLY